MNKLLQEQRILAGIESRYHDRTLSEARVFMDTGKPPKKLLNAFRGLDQRLSVVVRKKDPEALHEAIKAILSALVDVTSGVWTWKKGNDGHLSEVAFKVMDAFNGAREIIAYQTEIGPNILWAGLKHAPKWLRQSMPAVERAKNMPELLKAAGEVGSDVAGIVQTAYGRGGNGKKARDKLMAGAKLAPTEEEVTKWLVTPQSEEPPKKLTGELALLSDIVNRGRAATGRADPSIYISAENAKHFASLLSNGYIEAYARTTGEGSKMAWRGEGPELLGRIENRVMGGRGVAPILPGQAKEAEKLLKDDLIEVYASATSDGERKYDTEYQKLKRR